MTLDTRAEVAASAVRSSFDAMPAPDVRVLLRRSRRRRAGVSAVVVVALLAGALGVIALTGNNHGTRVDVATTPSAPLPPGAQVAGAWTVVPKESAGIGSGASLDAVTSIGDTFVAGGARPSAGGWAPAIWRSSDGVNWSAASIPAVAAGEVLAIAGDAPTHTMLAVASAAGPRSGIAGSASETPFSVWRSADAGATWLEVPTTSDAFGAGTLHDNAFVDDLVRFNGWWVAAGTAANPNGGAIWISRDGAAWERVVHSADAIDGISRGTSLYAYGYETSTDQEHTWTSDDAVHWQTARVDLPVGRRLLAVAPSGQSLLGVEGDATGQPRQRALLSSTDGSTWSLLLHFDDEFANALPGTVAQFGADIVVAGFNDDASHPGAWITTDVGVTWHPIPPSIQGPPGGMLQFVARVRDRVVLFGGAPELDRFYVVDAGAIR
jgi:hypothetical protein